MEIYVEVNPTLFLDLNIQNATNEDHYLTEIGRLLLFYWLSIKKGFLGMEFKTKKKQLSKHNSQKQKWHWW